MKNFTSCFKENKFLQFFFKRIRQNNTERYQEFPFISLCGRERNFIRCDDVPIVYTHIITKDSEDVTTYGHAGDLLVAPFMPDKIYMLPTTGRVYHPTEENYGGIALVRSKLAIELSKNFVFQNGDDKPPTHFRWKNKNYELDQFWFQEKVNKFNIKIKEDPD